MSDDLAKGLAAAVDQLDAEGAMALADDAPELPLGELGVALPRPAAARQGPGRPAGSRNRATELARARLLEYGSPLERLAQIASMGLVELAKEASCTRHEAVKLQIAAADKLAPYLHSRMPVEIEAKGGLIPALMIVEGGGMAVAAARDPSIVILDHEEPENDGKSDT